MSKRMRRTFGVAKTLRPLSSKLAFQVLARVGKPNQYRTPQSKPEYCLRLSPSNRSDRFRSNLLEALNGFVQPLYLSLSTASRFLLRPEMFQLEVICFGRN